MVSKLMSDALHRFKRILIPEMLSPKDSFWGGEKTLLLNQKVEIARVGLDLPSFFTVEIFIPSNSAINVDIQIEIGVGRSVMVRTFNAQDLSGAPAPNGDPLYQLSVDNIVTSNTSRIRFVVWGTSLKVACTALDALTAGAKYVTTVTPGASPLVAATIVGYSPNIVSSPAFVASHATRQDVNQNAASVTIVGAGKNMGLTIYNDSAGGAALHLRDASDGGAATLADFSRVIPSKSWWEMPGPPFYTGEIKGIWTAGGAGKALITIWSL